MKNYLKYIIIAAGLLTSGVAYAAWYPVQTQSFFVGGAGSTVGDTTLTLQSFNSSAGAALSMSSFGAIGYGTIEPGNPGQEENVDFTGITDNSNGTVTLTGVQDIGLLYPFTVTNSIQINHAGGVTFALSNSSAFYYYQFALLNDAQTIAANWVFGTSTASTPPTSLGTPSSSTSIVNKSYVDTALAGATSTIGSGFLNLTASGQTVSGANTFSQTQTFSATQSFTGGAIFGNLLPTSTLTPTASTQLTTKAYVDGVAISGAPLATNVASGIVRIASSSQILNNASIFATTTPYVLTTALIGSTASTSNSFIVVTSSSTGKIDPSIVPAPTLASTTVIGSTKAFDIGKHEVVFNSSGLFTVPNGITTVFVQVIGGGGAGANGGSNLGGSGGGAGGYAQKMVDVSATTSISVTISSGGTTFFSTYASSTAGGAGSTATQGGGVGGTGGQGFGGDLNITGNPGQAVGATPGGFGTVGSNGGASYLGGSGMAGVASNNGGSGTSGGGGGGGGNSGGGGSASNGVVIITY